MRKFLVEEDFINTRLDKWFKKKVYDVPQSFIEKNLRRGNIKVNKKKNKSSYRLQKNDQIIISDFKFVQSTNKKKKYNYKPTKKELSFSSSIFIENNENFAVINKPAGIAVQSGTKSKRNLLDILRLTKEFSQSTAYTVHRIDKETTGVLIVAKNRTDAKISKLEPSYLSVSEEGIKTGLEAAKAKLAAAREANDLGAEATALQDISELGVRNIQLKDTKAAQEEYNKHQSTQKAPSLARSLAAKGTPDPKAEAWAEKNSWFGQNNAMTYTAMDLHDKLTKQEGFDSSSDEYYAEIDKRIKLEFPQKFDRTTLAEGTTKPVQTVASAKRSTKTGRKTVRLTPSQVSIAKKLGVPLEEYAKQLNITKEA